MPQKKQMLIIAAIIIVLILVAFFLITNITSSTTTQKINYSDLTITKTITFLGTQRTENYSFELKNPIVAFLIIPKTIISDASQIKTSGDFKSEIIKADPILMLTSNDYSPGTKNVSISVPTGDSNQTTILFAIPLAEYNKLTTEEKQTLIDTINQLAIAGKENFTITNSQTVMQSFATSQKNAGFEDVDSVVKKKIYFSDIPTNNTATSPINTIIQNITSALLPASNNQTQNTPNDNTSPQNNPTALQNASTSTDFLTATIQSLTNAQIKQNNTVLNKTDGAYTVSIQFGASNSAEPLPHDINLYVSDDLPNDSVLINFNIENTTGHEIDYSQIKTSVDGEPADDIISQVSGEAITLTLGINVFIPQNKLVQMQEGSSY